MRAGKVSFHSVVIGTGRSLWVCGSVIVHDRSLLGFSSVVCSSAAVDWHYDTTNRTPVRATNELCPGTMSESTRCTTVAKQSYKCQSGRPPFSSPFSVHLVKETLKAKSCVG
ncbi:hypothetical protein SeMB42_g03149 [Synchytrium endobioticum]|uniref:Uncharacterized protein n=1 Tax=Synchytrium endobioticum TaxID=286115 RepID=A0A507D8R8_9FUNG|nr:hypothetical protein SeMB42_g03149 [Synchytrium endobioticum]